MDWDERVYGDHIADINDDLYEEAFDTAGAVAFLIGHLHGHRTGITSLRKRNRPSPFTGRLSATIVT